MRRRRTLTVACLGIAMAVLAACSGTGGQQSGGPTGGLVLYSGRAESLVGGLLAEFTERTGIKVETRYGDTAELAAQLIEEGDRSPGDVFFSQDAGALQALENAGMLTSLPPATLDQVFPIYRSPRGKWVGTSGRARVLLYNSGLVPTGQVPDRVADLTNPKWKGQVGIAPTNASFQSFVTGMRIVEGNEKTGKWLSAMVANDVQKFDNNVAIRDAVDSGQVKLGLANHYYWYEKAAQVGAEKLKVRNHFLAAGDPGSLVNVAGVGIIAGTANPDAQRLVDFLLSPQAQQYFAKTTFEYPLVKDVAAADGLPPLADLKGPGIGLGQLADLEETQRLLRESGLL